MQKVLGIGGLFFRSENPGALAEWYKDHLGISLVPTDASGVPWTTEAGITVFSPFAADTLPPFNLARHPRAWGFWHNLRGIVG